jgi:hypothetical protein
MNIAVPRAALRTVSNHGTPVTPTTKQQEFLATVGGGNLRLLRESEGLSVYSYQVGGQTCYAAFPAAAPAFRTVGGGSAGCLTGFPAFKSVYDHSGYRAHCPAQSPTLFFVAGVASNGVATVTLLDTESRIVARTKVVRNVYIIGIGSPLLFSRRATQVVARDTTGKIVFRNPGAPFACAPGAPSAPQVGSKTDV